MCIEIAKNQNWNRTVAIRAGAQRNDREVMDISKTGGSSVTLPGNLTCNARCI